MSPESVRVWVATLTVLSMQLGLLLSLSIYLLFPTSAIGGFMVLSPALVLLHVPWSVRLWFRRREPLSLSEPALVTMLLITCHHLTWQILVDYGANLFSQNFFLFLISAFIGLTSAAFCSTRKTLHMLENYINSCFPILSMIFAIFLVIFFLKYNSFIVSDFRQPISYFGSLLVGWYLFAKKKNGTVKQGLRASDSFYAVFCNTITAGLVWLIIILCLIHGGRGAMLLTLFFLASKLLGSVSLRRLHIKRVLSTLSIFALSLLFLVLSGDSQFAEDFSGIWRAVSFFYTQESGFALQIVGGRGGDDGKYNQAINFISAAPIVGYGVMALWEAAVHPHNIFLEVCLQFGVPIGVAFSLFFILKGHRLYSFLKEFPAVWVLFCFCGCYLILSGSYLRTPLFWFFLGLQINDYWPVKSRKWVG